MIDKMRKIKKLILIFIDMLITLFDQSLMLLDLLFRRSYA